MAMHDTIHILILLIYFAVNKALCVAFGRIWIYGACVFDMVLLKVIPTGDECWSERLRDEKAVGILRVSYGYMTVCYELQISYGTMGMW